MSRQNFTMFAGDDLQITVPVVDERTGESIDISQATSIKWSLARSVNGPAIIEKTLDNGISVNTPTSFLFNIMNTESDPLQGAYHHEAEVVTSQGFVYTVMSGRVTVNRTLI